tara:strand:+ start:55048 stop:55170 length:123 start_codon:yes stop_codon:yes gene_type:complete
MSSQFILALIILIAIVLFLAILVLSAVLIYLNAEKIKYIK